MQLKEGEAIEKMEMANDQFKVKDLVLDVILCLIFDWHKFDQKKRHLIRQN